MKLREWLDAECVEIKQLASRLDVSCHSVHNWLNKGIIPIRTHRAMIQRLTKGQVTIEGWNDGKETTDKRIRGGKKHELRGTQRVALDMKTKLKSGKKTR